MEQASRSGGSSALLSRLKVWRELEIGEFTKEDILQLFVQRGFIVSDLARRTIADPGFCMTDHRKTLFLYRATLADLGFSENAVKIGEVWEAICSSGYALCPQDTALYLRLKLTIEQEKVRSNRWIATDPIVGRRRVSELFSVGRNKSGSQWINSQQATLENRLTPISEVVFCGAH